MEKVLKWICTVIIFIICGLFILRCCMVADKSRLRDMSIGSEGGEISTISYIAAEMSDEGYFSAYALYYNETTDKLQITVRWNRSAYDYTYTEPGSEFEFLLRNETTGEEYPLSAVESDKMSIYSYRKLVAEGVEAADGDRLAVIMVLRDGYEGHQVVKYAEQPWEDYR